MFFTSCQLKIESFASLFHISWYSVFVTDVVEPAIETDTARHVEKRREEQTIEAETRLLSRVVFTIDTMTSKPSRPIKPRSSLAATVSSADKKGASNSQKLLCFPDYVPPFFSASSHSRFHIFQPSLFFLRKASWLFVIFFPFYLFPPHFTTYCFANERLEGRRRSSERYYRILQGATLATRFVSIRYSDTWLAWLEIRGKSNLIYLLPTSFSSHYSELRRFIYKFYFFWFPCETNF